MVEHFPNPEDDASQAEKNNAFEAIHASDEDVDWVQDPKSYFTVMPYPRSGKIMVRVYGTDNKPLYLIDGDHPRQIYYKMISIIHIPYPGTSVVGKLLKKIILIN